MQVQLRCRFPNFQWDVTNQAYVHLWYEKVFGYSVPPLESLEAGIASWPEYATCIGLFLNPQDGLEIIAPHGLADLFSLQIRRNPMRVSESLFQARHAVKGWTARWPRLQVVTSTPTQGDIRPSVQEQSMTTFCTSRTLPASTEAIFAAIGAPERLARWWGPNGFTNTFDVFEFQPGGRWIFTMHGPNGSRYPNESEFTEIVPNALVRIRHISHPHFVLSIGLQVLSEGTLVTWEQAFADEKVAESVRQIVIPANEQNLDRLAAEVDSSGG